MVQRCTVSLTAFAQIEARDAYDWYFERNPQSVEKFREELSAAVALLREAPGRWRIWRAPYRRMLLERFPFALIYRCLTVRRTLSSLACGISNEIRTLTSTSEWVLASCS